MLWIAGKKFAFNYFFYDEIDEKLLKVFSIIFDKVSVNKEAVRYVLIGSNISVRIGSDYWWKLVPMFLLELSS